MKIFALILNLVFLSAVFASHRPEEIKLVLRFQQQTQTIKAKGPNEKMIPIKFANKELEQRAKSFKPEQEVLVHGHVSYDAKGGIEGKLLHPVLLIEELHPVSLKELGEGKTQSEKTDTKLLFPIVDKTPATIGVSGDVANAITMTASLLMLQDLIPAEKQPGFNPGTNAALIFSAGALATGIFIYQQLKKSKSQKVQK